MWLFCSVSNTLDKIDVKAIGRLFEGSSFLELGGHLKSSRILEDDLQKLKKIKVDQNIFLLLVLFSNKSVFL